MPTHKFLDPDSGEWRTLHKVATGPTGPTGPMGPAGGGGGTGTAMKTIIDYGADPGGSASSDAAFAAFMADENESAVRIPGGNYTITTPIVMRSGKQMLGDHAARDGGETTRAAVITQYTNNAAIITGVDIRGVTLANLALAVADKANHTADGISFTRSANPATNYVTLKDVHVFGPGRDGISMSNLIVSAWSGVTVVNSGRHGFNLYGVEAGAAGTSVSMDACYANTCGAKETGHGFRIRKMTYLSLTGCASEGNSGSAYHVTQSQGISLAGCGAEAPFGPSSFYVGDASIGVTLNACWVYGNNGVAFDVDGAGTVAALVGCTEMDPVGATASFRTGAGTNVTLINPFGYTAKVLDASTVVLANVAGQVEASVGKFVTSLGNSVFAKPASGAAILGADRPSSSTFGQIEFRTAGATTNGWALTHLATTNNLRLWNFNGGKNALVLDSAGTYMDVVSKRIINVAEPTAATDAATKGYVDGHLTPAEVVAGTNVTVDRTTTPGSVIISAAGGGGGGLDQSVADVRYVNVDGDTMTGLLTTSGGINADNSLIYGLSEPTDSHHAATKGYVDGRHEVVVQLTQPAAAAPFDLWVDPDAEPVWMASSRDMSDLTTQVEALEGRLARMEALLATHGITKT